MKKTTAISLAIASSLLILPIGGIFSSLPGKNPPIFALITFIIPVLMSGIFSYTLFKKETDEVTKVVLSFLLGILFVAIGVLIMLALVFAACTSCGTHPVMKI
jgi:uncharacterized membrane protein